MCCTTSLINVENFGLWCHNTYFKNIWATRFHGKDKQCPFVLLDLGLVVTGLILHENYFKHILKKKSEKGCSKIEIFRILRMIDKNIEFVISTSIYKSQVLESEEEITIRKLIKKWWIKAPCIRVADYTHIVRFNGWNREIW